MTLKVVPSLPTRRLSNGRIVLTRKFLEGVLELHKFWANPLAVFLRESEGASGNLDEIEVSPRDFDFQIQVLNGSEIDHAIVADKSGIVLLSLDDFQQSDLWRVCRDNGVKCVYVSEYALTTRNQIIQETTPNPLKRWRRRMWESGQERKRRASVAGSSGLQCNGTPTYDSYKDLTNNAILYFDSRVTESLLASESEINARSASIKDRPLQLFFSGRLARMKGAMQLLHVAKELRTMGENFCLTICGDGELKEEMARFVTANQLEKQVNLRGVLDFKTELLPFVRSNVDVFVCCHPQGDPSCTYLETMSCGVPIAGYENEAFAGVVHSSEAGWLSPMNNPGALARTIAQIQKTPDVVRSMAIKSLEFAKDHTFEKTFSRRIDHLRNTLGIASK